MLPRARVAAILVALGAMLAVAASSASQGRPPITTIPIDRPALAAKVKAEFQFAWNAYARLAWGHDELNPVSRTPHDWYPPAVVYMTAVDALDTMFLMHLNTEAARVQQRILTRLKFDQDVSVQLFEINIRVLGALLTAYQMTEVRQYLSMAEDLGTRLLPAFNSPTGMPYRYVNLKTGATTGVESNPAEIGTLILEFGTLSKLTKKDTFFNRAKRALTALYERRSKRTGLVGEGINVDTGAWTNPASHIGGGIDSYYEYLLKCDRLFDDKDCRKMGKDGVEAINKYLADDGPGGLWYGESDMNTGKRTHTTYGALHAFLPTVFALTGDLPRAKRLQDSNLRMWNLYGIEPEELDYKDMRGLRMGYQLRPEIVESAYYLYHYTKDPKYLEMGRQFLDNLVACCRVADGYTVLKDVKTGERGDRMHSFLLAETFKYLYLLFSSPDDTVDFNTVTFNTEAHPLKRTW